MYSIHEALAYERSCQRREIAASQRRANSLSAARRWAWLASYSRRRQLQSQQLAEATSASSYELAG